MKNAISILQEYAVEQHIALPIYQMEDRTSSCGPSFRCHCTFHQIQTNSSATSKKAAKTLSAEAMMDKLGLNFEYAGTVGVKQEEGASKAMSFNAIGSLNEMLVKNGQPYAFYTELGLRNGMFVTKCTSGNLTTEGFAGNKKGSKHNAALAMLEALQSTNSIDYKPVIKVPSVSPGSMPTSDMTAKTQESLLMDLKEEPIETKPNISMNNTLDTGIKRELKSPSKFVNYVGKLNEYTSQYTSEHPVYTELGRDNGYFVIQVNHKMLSMKGYGATKKDAKQQAAKQLLETIGDHPGQYTGQFVSPMDDQTVIDKFNELSMVGRMPIQKDTVMQDPFGFSFVDNIMKVDVNSEEVRLKEEKLKSADINYTIEEISSNPYILNFNCTKSPMGQFTLMEMDCSSRNRAVSKLLDQAFKKLKIENC